MGGHVANIGWLDGAAIDTVVVTDVTTLVYATPASPCNAGTNKTWASLN
jgi:hypothetical protein